MNFLDTRFTPTYSQFLTYGEDEVIWAKISDKDVSIHIRFNKEAVAEYNMFVIASSQWATPHSSPGLTLRA